MNKIFFLFIILFALSIQLHAQDMYKVKADKLRVRETNDPKSKIIGFLPQNENVAVLDTTNAKFYKIKVTNGQGWVSKEFLEKIASAKKPEVKAAVALEIPKTAKSYSDLIFFIVVALIMGFILYFIFKYSKQNKILIGLTTIIVLIVIYFCFVTFVKEKVITGVYVNDVEAQYKSFDFKSKDSVEVKDIYTDSTFTTKYTIDGDMIKMYDQQNTILLLIRNENTLVGEGFTKGNFSKK
ncbi:SH3 domain-containing protein [Pedobacter changchengzhani]|uniref:SH3 domain-containing protein n=1 Tax=Pedobacter changchengzhani TaxID=2529274 RepID=A0A4R5MHC8_9SPHI|nr:SH3 domain-containing protein [Pedobacter changchengzhani]TDG34947.1 SH3 domain-containing protein [Pedobacter changchengzhani]